MRNKAVVLATLLLIYGLWGCRDGSKEEKLGEPMSIRIVGVTGRADLDPNLHLGLFVAEPVNADNVRLGVSANGAAVSDDDLRWSFAQSSASRFFAYLPYDASFTGKQSVVADMPSDQSTREKLLSANIMTSLTSGAPGEYGVVLRMKHAMTAMMVEFDNRTGEKIESMTVSGFMTQYKIDFVTGSLSATGTKSLITPLRSDDGGDSFLFLYPPQDGTPVFTVTMESGRKIKITYNNYCHEYSGSLIRMNRILLTESTPNENILELDGVNISQWSVNGVPRFNESPIYHSLASLGNVETDKDDQFFSAYINKVTVTVVDKSNPDGQAVIIEDSTRAIYAWVYPGIELKAGNTIVGPVMGYMDKPKAGEYHISSFYTNYATIGKADSLPATKGSFITLTQEIDRLEYRRMQFEGVTLVERFDNGRAVFDQNGTVMSVVCAGFENDMLPGVTGMLTGFPVRYGSDILIMVYDDSQFAGFSKEELDSDFTRYDILGYYDLSQPDTVICSFAGLSDGLQYSLKNNNGNRSMQVADADMGVVQYFYLYDCPDSPVVGHEFCVVFNTAGNTGLRGSTMYMECVKCSDNKVWLIDRSGSKGLVLAL